MDGRRLQLRMRRSRRKLEEWIDKATAAEE
jgi:hypothetical protein